jgi:bacterial/archaeal transporter family-2 protein
MMGLVWSLLGIVSGTLIGIQAPVNAELGRVLGSPVAAAAASFVAGSVALLGIALAVCQLQGVSVDWRAPPFWILVGGGLLGAAYVTSVIIINPKLGTAATMAFVVSGQLLAGMLLDHVGAFNMAVREISFGRVTGAVLLLVGALLIRIS